MLLSQRWSILQRTQECGDGAACGRESKIVGDKRGLLNV